MVKFLHLQFKMGKITEEQINYLISEKKITEEDKVIIMTI